MQMNELLSLVESVQSQKFESKTLEVKSAHEGCPSKLYPTLSSFSNQDDGGIILFGLSEEEGFNVVGVYDPQDIQKKVLEQCKQMEPVIRPLFTFGEVRGKMIVSAEIPSSDILERPVYYRGVGRVKGSFIRVGESDETMSEYEIYSYDAYRKRIQDDLRIVNNANVSQFTRERLNGYLKSVKENRKNLAANVSDNDIMELMGITKDGIPTVAGIMIFSKYPQGYFPQFSITAVSLPGTEMGEIGTEGERFIDNRRITGTISEMLDDALDFVRMNSRTKTILGDDGKRHDRLEYPLIAIREAILNGLVHRDYSIHTQSVPIRIEMYRDRLEIINPGGLYGKITIDSLGMVHPDTRNAAIANILELLGETENRYSGIPTIRLESHKAGIPPPTFEVYRGEFKVIFRNTLIDDQKTKNWQTVQKELIDFCTIPKTKAEIIEFTGYTRFYTTSKILQPLVDKGILKMSNPANPKSPKQTYVKNLQ